MNSETSKKISSEPPENQTPPPQKAKNPRPVLRRQATEADGLAVVSFEVPEEELRWRDENYQACTPKQFGWEHADRWDRSATLTLDGVEHRIQVNFCTNPLCEHFGLPQETFKVKSEKISGRDSTMSRYHVIGTGGKSQPKSRLRCNPIRGRERGINLENHSETLSNWSAALEISRLANQDRIVHPVPDYDFHREGCPETGKTPMEHPEAFHRKGKSSSNCQKWRCKSCGKMQNVLPPVRQNQTYGQKRSEINLRLAEMLVNKSPIIRTCDELLHLSPTGYYWKLYWLRDRCLEFLEKHERQAFAEHGPFDFMCIGCDALEYHLNNARKRGQAEGHSKFPFEDPMFQTSLVASADASSRYVFRADISFDPQARLDDIEAHTRKSHEDHLQNFTRKHDRYGRYSVSPQEPTPHDDQTRSEFNKELDSFTTRRSYVDGLHVDPTYTTLAQLFLLKEMIHTENWRVITDTHGSMMTAVARVFAQEILAGKAHHLLYQIDKKVTKEERFKQYLARLKEIRVWAGRHGFTTEASFWGRPNFATYEQIAGLMLTEQMEDWPIYGEFKQVAGSDRKLPSKYAWYNHPNPHQDEGERFISAATDLTELGPSGAADLLTMVNMDALNSFFNLVRRRLSLLERPITGTGADVDGRSYIYVNHKPEVAQAMCVVLRTYVNFMKPFGRQKRTPAQWIGIADRVYDWRDVVYFR